MTTSQFLLFGIACIALVCVLNVFMANAKEKEVPPPFVIAPLPESVYHNKALEMEEFRQSRQLSIQEALAMLADKKTVLLDVRGDGDYARVHIKGAKHLSYADMTVDRLAALFPDKNTRIILYCDVAMLSPPTRMAPLSMNAFVDMQLYGYKNLYEIRKLYSIQPYQAQCQEILNAPLEGNASAIAEVKERANACLLNPQP